MNRITQMLISVISSEALAWFSSFFGKRNAKRVVHNVSGATDVALIRALLYISTVIEKCLGEDIDCQIARKEHHYRMALLKEVGRECVSRDIILKDDLRVVLADFQMPCTDAG